MKYAPLTKQTAAVLEEDGGDGPDSRPALLPSSSRAQPRSLEPEARGHGRALGLRAAFRAFARWFDADFAVGDRAARGAGRERVDWVRCLPFIVLHLGCLGVWWVGWSWTAVLTAVFLYVVRMFAITGFYHRFFSHRAFSTSRWAQGVFAVLGACAVQRGPLWWAATHRCHHQHSDQELDPHSPRRHGFWWSHIGWILSEQHFPTDYRRVRDLARFPELVFLNRFDALVPALLALGLFLVGAVLERTAPGLGVTGAQMLVWGFFISTTLLFHATCCINSLAHLMGRQRFDTQDDSRNSLWLALITLGEGWHNNHHRYMSCARQGLYWWEIDITYYLLKVLARLGIIWDLRPFPAEARDPARQLGAGSGQEAAGGTSAGNAAVARAGSSVTGS